MGGNQQTFNTKHGLLTVHAKLCRLLPNIYIRSSLKKQNSLRYEKR